MVCILCARVMWVHVMCGTILAACAILGCDQASIDFPKYYKCELRFSCWRLQHLQLSGKAADVIPLWHSICLVASKDLLFFSPENTVYLFIYVFSP